MIARERFRAAVRQAGGARQVAGPLRCSRAYVDMLAKGGRTPGLRIAVAIEDALGVPARAWVDQALPAVEAQS